MNNYATVKSQVLAPDYENDTITIVHSIGTVEILRVTVPYSLMIGSSRTQQFIDATGQMIHSLGPIKVQDTSPKMCLTCGQPYTEHTIQQLADCRAQRN